MFAGVFFIMEAILVFPLSRPAVRDIISPISSPNGLSTYLQRSPLFAPSSVLLNNALKAYNNNRSMHKVLTRPPQKNKNKKTKMFDQTKRLWANHPVI